MFHTRTPIASLRSSNHRPLAYLYLSLTNLCNARCVYCDIHDVEVTRTTLPPDAIAELLDQARTLGAETIHLIGGGEPTIDPLLPSVLSAIGERDLSVVLTTNGSRLAHQAPLLAAVDLQVLILSLDSHRAEDHDAVRRYPGLFQKAMDGVVALRSFFPELRLVINHVLTTSNQGELPEMAAFAAEIGSSALNVLPVKDRPELVVRRPAAAVRATVTAARRELEASGAELLGSTDDIAAHISGDFSHREHHCYFPQHTLFVDLVSGCAYPCDCSSHRPGPFVLGNVLEQPLEEIWTGRPAGAIRDALESTTDPGCKRLCDPFNMQVNHEMHRAEISLDHQ